MMLIQLKQRKLAFLIKQFKSKIKDDEVIIKDCEAHELMAVVTPR